MIWSLIGEESCRDALVYARDGLDENGECLFTTQTEVHGLSTFHVTVSNIS
jgi:hypothetical protein